MSLRDRIGAYRAIFWNVTPVEENGELHPAADIVLRDLARVCYATKTTASANPLAMAAPEGRRQVWLHIKTQLRLTDSQVDRILTEVESQDDRTLD